jgi:hypothetical protein
MTEHYRAKACAWFICHLSSVIYHFVISFPAIPLLKLCPLENKKPT